MIRRSGQPPGYHKLLEPGIVPRAIEQAQVYWDATQDIAGTVARLIANISFWQPFREGNHRTAYTLAHEFLRQNGYEALAPANDWRLVEILARDRDLWPSSAAQLADLTRLFRKRLDRWFSVEGQQRLF